MKRINWILALVALGVAFTGCDTEETSSYDILINWNIAGGQGDVCAATLNGPSKSQQVDFDKVRISIYEDAESKNLIQDPIEVNCTDYSYTLSRLERGSYYIRLGAFADFEGDYLPYYQAEGEVEAPGVDKGYKFILNQGQGSIKVTWSFDNKQMCDPNEVDEIEVSLAPGDRQACNDGMFLIKEAYWSEHRLDLSGYNSDGKKTWYGQYKDGDPFEVKPGQVYEAHVELSEI